MLSVMKNDIERVMEMKVYMIISVFLIVCAVAAAIFLTGKMQGQMNIALVGDKENSFAKELKTNSSIKFEWREETPKMSELVTQKYDAVVKINQDGSYKLTTVKSKKVEKQIQMLLENPSYSMKQTQDIRKKGTSIIGFMMMFILMQGILNARFFAEDKEKHLTERVITTPLRFGSYLAGHGLFIWLFIILPSMCVLLGAKLLGFHIGFSIPVYLLLIAILAFLSFSFALCINAFFKVADLANMLGSSILILTSILAGSFGSFGEKHSLFNRILSVLPQKDFIQFANALEHHSLTRNSYYELIYVILISILFLGIGVVKTRKDYIYR